MAIHCTAPHAEKIKALYITSELVFINDHGRLSYAGEERLQVMRIPKFLGFDPCFLEERIHGREYNKFSFSSCSLHSQTVLEGYTSKSLLRIQTFQESSFGTQLSLAIKLMKKDGQRIWTRERERDWGDAYSN